jgi:hypothetical protein
MKKVKVIEGVIAEYQKKYWGNQEWNNMDFGDIQRAYISNPKFCKKPTDKTYNPKNTNDRNPDFDKLSKAKLIRVKKQ